jgi:HAMP domain-containing protein
MKTPRQSSSEVETTMWLIVAVLLALILLTGYFLWKRISPRIPRIEEPPQLVVRL